MIKPALSEGIEKENNVQFETKFQEIKSSILNAFNDLYVRVSVLARDEAEWKNIDIEFSSILDESKSILDPFLVEIYRILEEYNLTDTVNIWWDLLHIWRGFANSLWWIEESYKKDIDCIVNPTTHKLSFIKWYSNKWSKLANCMARYIKETQQL